MAKKWAKNPTPDIRPISRYPRKRIIINGIRGHKNNNKTRTP